MRCPPSTTRANTAEPDWPDELRIGTASPGGTYYVYGVALAKILTRALDLPVERLATDGPVQNIELMEADEVKLGFVTIGVALQAWNGTGVWAGKKPARSMRAIFPMYDTPFQFLVLQEPGIRSVAEMAGKRVGVGPAGGTAAAYFPEFFRLLNVPVSLAYGEWAGACRASSRAQARRARRSWRRAVSLVHRARGEGQGEVRGVYRQRDRRAAPDATPPRLAGSAPTETDCVAGHVRLCRRKLSL
jgi:NMT1 family protein